jgi:alcohol dehydrogenase (cytochrome c)
MMKSVTLMASMALAAIAPTAIAQVKDFTPVTREMLLNPSPNDWLMMSRTYDEHRFSPLSQITKQNVGQLRLAWSRGMSPGIHEHIPLVHDGVMYVADPGGMQALDAINGDLIWDYRRKDAPGRSGRTMAIFQDLIIYAAPNSMLVGLDARTGKVRWEAPIGYSSSGPKVIDGKVILGLQAGRNERGRIVALDALTGKELWKFYTTPAPGEPGGDTWGDVAVEKRVANPWGLPGSYDPIRRLIYWGIANPDPYTRLKRHGRADAIPESSPADLYSDSTVALNPETGKLAWYYQYLPGDDWDEDHTHERILLRTVFNPDPKEVKWINPRIPRGQERDVVVTVAEAGGIWVLDRDKGDFLWATPFPYDSPEFNLSKIDTETGKTYINWDLVFKEDGERHVICAHNTKGYWPAAYDAGKNALYVPYNDQCLDMTANNKAPSGFGPREGVLRPGADPQKYGGLAKINMATGKVEWRYTQRAPTNGAAVVTAGDLVFWGDMNRRFRAFDAGTGRILWETILGGMVQNSTITYAVNGKQYVAVLTGDSTADTRIPLNIAPELKAPRGHNAIYVFALP